MFAKSLGQGLQEFGQWLGGGDASGDAKLRELSLEYKESELLHATQGLDPMRRLGKGNYASVYKGTLRDGSEVAVKVLERHNDDGGDAGFADEVRVLSRFRHPNLVTLMGWAQGPDKRYLVYEILQGGDVHHRLVACRTPGGKPFAWSERLSVVLDACCGLAHMHNSTPKAFHRDIKSANILLDRSGVAKMADFGLSGIAKRGNKLDMTCEQVSGTPGYACPHYIQTGRVSEQSEVFAFGMVILEIMLNTPPACLGPGGALLYPIFQTIMPQSPGATERTLAALDTSAAWPTQLAREMVELALLCSHIEEHRRPPFTAIANQLRQFVAKSQSGAQQPLQQGPPRAIGQGCGAGANGGVPVTNPQMPPHQGYSCGAGVVPVTKPQMAAFGTPPQQPYGTPATNPQIHGVHGGYAPPTNPQFSTAAPMSAPMQQGVRRFMDAINELWATGNEEAPAASPDLIEVVLECVFAVGVDLSRMHLRHKSYAMKAKESPWTIGRQQQPMLFTRLVPDEVLRTVISRSHFELRWEAPTLWFKKVTPNQVILNGSPAPSQAVQIANGGHIGILGQDQRTPILNFVVLLRDAATVAATGLTPLPTHLDTPAPPLQMQHQPQVLSYQQDSNPLTQVPCGPQSLIELICLHSRCCDVGTCRPEQKTIKLPCETGFFVGRQHQPGFFEHLLGAEQRFLTCVSRTHIELASVAGDPSSLDVTNCSANPIRISGQQLGKGNRGRLRRGSPDASTIEFIAATPDSPTLVVYLCLAWNSPSAGGQHCQGASSVVAPTPLMHPTPQETPQIPLTFNSTVQPAEAPYVHPTPQPAPQIPVTIQATPQPAEVPQKYASQPGVQSPAQHPQQQLPQAIALVSPHAMSSPVFETPTASTRQPFHLCLLGTAVRDSFPASRGRIESTTSGLTVGRAHQLAMFKDGLIEGTLQFISRDHFRIEVGKCGQWQLVALSSNPIWRRRLGAQLIELEKGTPFVPLEDGDDILMFTGADDCTADGPGCNGTLRFSFSESAPAPNMLRAAVSKSSDTFTPRAKQSAAGALRPPVFGLEMDDDD